MSFIADIKQRAKQNIKTIVLPEGNDIRVIEAASIVAKEKFAKVVLVGNETTIQKQAEEKGFDLTQVEIINPVHFEKQEEYVQKLYELRQRKGMTMDKAKELLFDPVYYAMMMVKQGDCDGLVSGAAHSTSDTLRPALQILKTAPNTKLVSAFFIMVVPNCEYGENGIFLFADSGLNENPDSEALSEIAISSSKSFKQLVGKEAKIAMLSYSTYGSAKSESTEKMIKAAELVKEKAPEIIVDGELQLDAAIIPEVAEFKAKGSPLQGHANTLIFPDLNSGNIGYKLAQRLAKAEAYGPLCQGIAKPVNDLSRGCSAQDIVGVVAITAVQAQSV